MSASHAPALDAITLQLAAALEKYEQDVAAMIDSWLDVELYNRVSREIEEIRMYSTAIPMLSLQWVELLIAHAELVHSLWRLRLQQVDRNSSHVETLRQRHAGCVATLRSRCLRLLARSGETSG
jgi:hypothetical protein